MEQLTASIFFSYFFDYFITNFLVMLMCVIPMFLLLLRHPMIGKNDLRSFHFVLIFLVVMCLLDGIEHMLATFGDKYWYNVDIRKYICVVCYMIKPIVVMCVCFTVVPVGMKLRKFLWIPLAVNVLVYAINLIPGMEYFTIHGIEPVDGVVKFNVWDKQGPFGILVYFGFVAAFAYILILIAFSIRAIKTRNIGEALAVLVSIAFVIIGYAIEAEKQLFNVGDNATAVSCLFFLLFLVIKFASFDPLTELHNRQAFYSDIKREKRVNAIISIDMNDLKVLNDKYGHIRGDEAIKTTADVISKRLYYNSNAYRVGGDEFIITCPTANEDKVKTICDGIVNDMNKTKFSIAIGYACRGEEDSVRAMMSRADNMMYTNKTAIKKVKKEAPQEQHVGMITPKKKKA